MARVPEITAYFWLVKILTTGAGETTSDFLGHHFNPILVAVIGAVALLGALMLQFRMRRYVAWAYWLAVSMVAIFGTMAADVFHGLGVPYFATTIVLAAVLAVIFVWWYRSERTLSMHSITTRRRETFYWATVVTTFALGTATGDLTATTFGWGYFTSGVVFAIAIGIVGVGHALLKRPSAVPEGGPSTSTVLAFWFAYVLTRPLGASFADWMGEPTEKGGLAWGDGLVSTVLFVVIVAIVWWLSVTRIDVQGKPAVEVTS